MAQIKQSLDKDLEKIVHVEAATRSMAGSLGSHGIALVFLALAALIVAVFSGVTADSVVVILAAVLGGYMALNIGANDVANAISPLAAILRAVEFGDVVGKVAVSMWIMMIGAFGISPGLFLYGPKLIRMVGDQITKMNPMRAYCVALSAAITVITASWLGLPVSSTHIAVGAVFGVGFF